MTGLLLALSLLTCDTLVMDTMDVSVPFCFDISTIRITLVYEETDTVFSGSIWGYLDFLQVLEDVGYEVEVMNDSVVCKRNDAIEDYLIEGRKEKP